MALPVINQIIGTCDPKSEAITIHGENFTNGNNFYITYVSEPSSNNSLLSVIDATNNTARKQLILDFITNGRARPAYPSTGGAGWQSLGTQYTNNIFPYLMYIDSQTVQVNFNLSAPLRTFPVYATNASGNSNVWMLNEPKSYWTEWTVRPSWRKYRRSGILTIFGRNLCNGLTNAASAAGLAQPRTPGSVWLQQTGSDANPVYEAEIINQEFDNSDRYCGFSDVVYFRPRVLPTTSSTAFQYIPEGTYHVYTSQDTHAWGVCYHGTVTLSDSDYNFNNVDASAFTYNSDSYSFSPFNSGTQNSKALLAATYQAAVLTDTLANGYIPRVVIPPGTYKIDRRLPLPDGMAIHALTDGSVTIVSDPDVDFSNLSFDPNWTTFPTIPVTASIDSTRYYKPVGPISSSGISITSVTNAAPNPYVVTTSTSHGYSTGDKVYITGVTGHGGNPNGIWTITVLSGTTFSLKYPSNNANSEALGTGDGSGGTVLKLTNTSAAFDINLGDEGWLWSWKGNWIKGINVVSTWSNNPKRKPIPAMMNLFDKNPSGDPTTVGNNSIENCVWYHAQYDKSTLGLNGAVYAEDHAALRFNTYSGSGCSGTIYGVTYPGTTNGYHFNNEVINLKAYSTEAIWTAPKANPIRSWFENIEVVAPGNGLYGIALYNSIHTESMLRNIKIRNTNRGINTIGGASAQLRTLIHEFSSENCGRNEGGDEQILWENGGYLCTSVTYNAGTPSVTFTPSTAITVKPNHHIVITSGPGKGQYRRIIAISGTAPNGPYTATLESAFNGTISNTTSIMCVGNYTTQCVVVRPVISNVVRSLYLYGGALDFRLAGGKFSNVTNCVMQSMRTNSGNMSPQWFTRFDSMEVFTPASVFAMEIFLDAVNSTYIGLPSGGSFYHLKNNLVHPRNFITVFDQAGANFTVTNSWNHIINGFTVWGDRYDVDYCMAHGTSGSVSQGQQYCVPRELHSYPWNFPSPVKIQGLNFYNLTICGKNINIKPDSTYHRNIWGDDTSLTYTQNSINYTIFTPSGNPSSGAIANNTDDGTTPLTALETRGDVGVISTTITNQLSTINTTVNTINSTTSSTNTTVGTINTNVNTANSTLSSLSTTVGTINTNVNTANSTLNDVNNKVDNISTDSPTIDNIDANVSALIVTTSNMSTNVGSIKTKVDNFTFDGSRVISTLNGETVEISADGLSNISMTPPTSTPETLVDHISLIYYRLYGKIVLDRSGGLLSVYVPNSANPVAIQSIVDNQALSSTDAAVFNA